MHFEPAPSAPTDRRGSSCTRLFGLVVLSSRPLPWGLERYTTSTEPDVEISWGDRPLDPPDESATLWWESPNRDSRGVPALRISTGDGGFRLVYSDGTQFFVSHDGRRIDASWPDTLSEEDAAIYLLGPVFGFVLRLRGVVCLHAGVVQVGSKVVALAGGPNAGKSTTCAALALRRWPVLSDDLAAISREGERYFASAAWPHIRLWPPAVTNLFGTSDALPPLVKGSAWDKRRFDLHRVAPVIPRRDHAPLDMVVVLAERSDEMALRLLPLSPSKAFSSLLANTYPESRIPRALLEQELNVLAGIASSVPVVEVHPHRDIAELPRLCDLIESLGRT